MHLSSALRRSKRSRRPWWPNIRKEDTFRDYPKGRRHHTHRIPEELLEKLKAARRKARGPFVVTTSDGKMLRYEWYNRSLQRYCRELRQPVIGTHGLRHSTAELYLANGATADDLRRLFAHSSPRVTDRYLHNRGTRLDEISGQMRLFPKPTPPETPQVAAVSQCFPNDAQANVLPVRRR